MRDITGPRVVSIVALVSLAALAAAKAPRGADSPAGPFTDYRTAAPGNRHKITPADLPAPYATPSATNRARIVPRPEGAWPKAPAGFIVEQYATGLENPRLILTAPNGDLFVAESAPGRIRVLRASAATAPQIETFVTGLTRPFGIAFYPPGPNPKFVYVGNTDSIVRFPYENGDLKARAPQQVIVPSLPSGRGHWTRNVAFSRDGQAMYISVGSASNVDDVDTTPGETHRANILETSPEGGELRVFASGIRNPVGLAVDPSTGDVWTSVNERDGLGDNLVPDYITHVQRGGFYGWPWYYTGGHQDPRHAGKHPELQSRVIVPDVLLQPHNASLQLTFYTGAQFPAEYRGDVFAAEHGSWNREVRAGYEVIRIRRTNGRANGEYEDFVTGFVTPDGQVWGRPVGVAVASDGSLMVTDDGSNTVWRVRHTGDRR